MFSLARTHSFGSNSYTLTYSYNEAQQTLVCTFSTLFHEDLYTPYFLNSLHEMIDLNESALRRDLSGKSLSKEEKELLSIKHKGITHKYSRKLKEARTLTFNSPPSLNRIRIDLPVGSTLVDNDDHSLVFDHIMNDSKVRVIIQQSDNEPLTTFAIQLDSVGQKLKENEFEILYRMDKPNLNENIQFSMEGRVSTTNFLLCDFSHPDYEVLVTTYLNGLLNYTSSLYD